LSLAGRFLDGGAARAVFVSMPEAPPVTIVRLLEGDVAHDVGPGSRAAVAW
jgi:hypothetical protein